jgi:hypothetical protein
MNLRMLSNGTGKHSPMPRILDLSYMAYILYRKHMTGRKITFRQRRHPQLPSGQEIQRIISGLHSSKGDDIDVGVKPDAQHIGAIDDRNTNDAVTQRSDAQHDKKLVQLICSSNYSRCSRCRINLLSAINRNMIAPVGIQSRSETNNNGLATL